MKKTGKAKKLPRLLINRMYIQGFFLLGEQFTGCMVSEFPMKIVAPTCFKKPSPLTAAGEIKVVTGFINDKSIIKHAVGAVLKPTL